jgi:hypothetical protein
VRSCCRSLPHPGLHREPLSPQPGCQLLQVPAGFLRGPQVRLAVHPLGCPHLQDVEEGQTRREGVGQQARHGQAGLGQAGAVEGDEEVTDGRSARHGTRPPEKLRHSR